MGKKNSKNGEKLKDFELPKLLGKWVKDTEQLL